MRKGNLPARFLLPVTHDALYLLPSTVQGDAGGRQRLGRNALSLAQQPEQQVFHADVTVPETPGLFLGQHHDLARPFGEPLEHLRQTSSTRLV